MQEWLQKLATLPCDLTGSHAEGCYWLGAEIYKIFRIRDYIIIARIHFSFTVHWVHYLITILLYQHISLEHINST